jgi:hypothetical protein
MFQKHSFIIRKKFQELQRSEDVRPASFFSSDEENWSVIEFWKFRTKISPSFLEVAVP